MILSPGDLVTLIVRPDRVTIPRTLFKEPMMDPVGKLEPSEVALVIDNVDYTGRDDLSRYVRFIHVKVITATCCGWLMATMVEKVSET